ncbi:T9SS type A sorting domain-containing protein [Planktosalinus lacus]|uniref:Secretion system C-terminal sorting domain-containing protein n=1 Tax=Planktosalinus lacus TaxID=1526573 RepID=A0A8J2V8S5_9FLAO|nr:T9SS type A sorting domain-containing protein [Planktosalinus lacus]GGD85056.1 hypothetical protein GCM10011312_06410 [Planktosalinus lacus]
MKKILGFCSCLLFFWAYPQDGSPDLSFGDNGIVILDLSGDEHSVWGIDEKSESDFLVLISFESTSNDYVTEVFSFNEDGTPDSDFGVNGVVDITHPDFFHIGINVLSDNSFFIYSLKNNTYTISKYTEAGTQIVDFGDNGILQPFLNGGSYYSIILNDDLTFYIYGLKTVEGIPHLLFMKFFDDGTPDTTFGNDGVVMHSLGNVSMSGSTIKKTDDYLYADVKYYINDIGSKYIYRFLLNGEIDTTFGSNGMIEIPIEEEFNTNFNVFNNGDFLIGGNYFDYNTETMIKKTIKINPQGEIIQSFANNGVLNNYSGGYIQENQRFIVDASISDFEGGMIPIFKRYYANGTSDTSFGFYSLYLATLGDKHIKHLQNGKMLMVSSDIWYSPIRNVVLQRFNNDPLTVPDFEKNNVVVTPNPSNSIFYIQSSTPLMNTPYEIFDSLGKKVSSGHFNQTPPLIDLSHVNAGVYFLKIADSSQTFKLLKR